MIVIDVGCATYGGDSSIPYLIEEFQPRILLGLDPAIESYRLSWVGETYVVELPVAAWTHDGTVGFEVAGLRGHVEEYLDEHHVPCWDLATIVESGRRPGEECVLKMDAEGAEWALLPHLIERGVDKLLRLAWVEYHCGECGRGGGANIVHLDSCKADLDAHDRAVAELENRMGCEMHRWNR